MANNKFCTECGQRLEEGVKFCPNCGNAVPAAAAGTETQNNTCTPNETPNYTPGFSTRINDPEIQAAVNKNRRASRIFLLLFMPVPIIGACIYSLVTKQMELGQALIGGAVISGIILLLNILFQKYHYLGQWFVYNLHDRH